MIIIRLCLSLSHEHKWTEKLGCEKTGIIRLPVCARVCVSSPANHNAPPSPFVSPLLFFFFFLICFILILVVRIQSKTRTVLLHLLHYWVLQVPKSLTELEIKPHRHTSVVPKGGSAYASSLFSWHCHPVIITMSGEVN